MSSSCQKKVRLELVLGKKQELVLGEQQEQVLGEQLELKNIASMRHIHKIVLI